MRLRALCLAALLAGPVMAQDASLPDLTTCMSAEVARFERALKRQHDGPAPDRFDVADTGRIEHCAVLGIVRCDRSGDVLACQRALRSELEALTAEVRQHLPDPANVVGQGGDWSDGLYPLLHALAHGHSAGPDCVGQVEQLETWCHTMEAGRMLTTTVLAWQLARYLRATPPATEAGWVRPALPQRPVARGEAQP